MKFKLLVIFLFSSILFSKEISIKTEDGFVLKGWLEFPTKQKSKYPLAVMAHQFGSSHKRWIDFSKELRDMGYATLNVDLRGHGKSILRNDKTVKIVKFKDLTDLKSSIKKSSKIVKFKNITNDIIIWIEYVSDKYKKVDVENISFFGASLGGAALLGAMFEYEPKYAVLFSPGKITETGGDGEIDEISSPIMLITSAKDFAFSRTIKYTEKANLPTTVILPGNGHGEALLKHSMQYVKQFIKRSRRD